jgi:RHS repeat-associated protein
LTGPNGYVGFRGLTGSSDLVTLPSSGTYAVTAYATGGQTGSYSMRVRQTTVTNLVLGQTYPGRLEGSGQALLFKVAVPVAKQMLVDLRDSSGADLNELYAKYGSAPTRGDYDYRYSNAASANAQILVPTATPGDWYILVYAERVPNPSNFTLATTTASIFLTSVTPDHAGSSADAVLTLTGSGFDRTTRVALVGDVMTYPADVISVDLPTQITATFRAGTVPAGIYTVRAEIPGGDMSVLANAFRMTASGQPRLVTNLTIPSVLGYHGTGTIYVDYANTGDVAMPAPLLVLDAQQNGRSAAFFTLDQSRVVQGFWTSAVPDGFSHTIQILASGATPGVLQPGESVRVPVYYAGWQKPWDFRYPPINFQLGVFKTDDARSIDWNALKDGLRPPGVTADAWDAIFTNLVAQTGGTWGTYVAMLDGNAAYLGRLGLHSNDVSQLWNFNIEQAIGLRTITHLGDVEDARVAAPAQPLLFSRFFAPSVAGRYRLGSLGRGWTWAGGWDQTLSVLNDRPDGGPGTVIIQGVGQSQRRFQPDQRGGYFSQVGDYAKLTNPSSGVYDLRELNGLTTRFRDGRIEYIEDSNGNRVTATYTSGRLTRLAHSSGQFLQIDYSTAGRVQFVTDPAGRRTTYSYDPSNEYLLSVQTPDGLITRYDYDRGSDPRKKHALLMIEHPGNTHEFFGYDAQGRLNDAHRDNNAQQVTFSYSLGTVAATDAANHITQYFFDSRGLIAKVLDPLLNPLYFAYDNAFNLTQVTDALGQVYRYRYDANGNLVQSSDALGSLTGFTYGGSFNRLSSFTEPKGSTTQYAYDAAGNLNSITYADNSIERFQPDSHGNPTQWTNRRQRPIQYRRDAAGRVRSEVFADGLHVDYNYDDLRGTLQSATDSSGTTTLRYEDPQHPDRVTRLDYPGGRFLAFGYDDAGRRAQMTDQGGFTVKYRYDEVGRLWKLLDGSDNVIVQYTYDPTGRLRRKDNGNRTYTTYDYTETGQVQHLVNYAPNGTVNSRFDYEYDALGRQTAMVTLEGRWTYGYDAIGQLTSVQLPNGRRIQYSYDRDGNRTSVIDNNVRTDYTSNNLNQYVTVGTVTYGYDADGNLISKRDGSNLSTFTYDDKNRLIRAVTPDGTWVYEYDVFGNRRASIVNGQRTDYLIDPSGLGDVVGEYNGAGLVAHYTHGLGLTSRVDPAGAASYYDFEAIGSTAGLSSSSGTYINRYSYLPFGERLSSNETISNPFGFIGQFGVMREANGLDFMRARYYSESNGRFLTPDPIGLGGGNNFYAYVRNRPVRSIDPLGLWELEPSDCVGTSAAAGLWAGFFAGISASCGGSVGPSIGIGIGPGCLGPGLYCAGCSLSLGATVSVTSASSSSGIGYGVGVGPSSVCTPFSPPDVPNCPDNAPSPNGTGQCCNSFGECDFPPPPAPPPSPPPCDPSVQSCGGGSSGAAGSMDPNEKTGPSGFGSAHFVAIGSDLPYRIDFENDARATAPAQRVDITDRLDPSLDWDTFQLTEIGFGDTLLQVPAGSRHFQTTVSMTYRGQTFNVEIEAGIRSDTGKVFATFQSVDPSTSLPPDVLTGFLPPEDGSGRGMGHVSYTVRPKANLTTGTQIRNIALVTFDLGETIATNQIDPHDPSRGTDPNKEAWVTIDAVPPTSSVDPLPKTSLPSFIVSWAGSDDDGGSGVGFFDIFVSTDGGDFAPWLVHTTLTGAIFNGAAGHSYSFYSVATDNAGNREPDRGVAQAMTTTATNAASVSIVVNAQSIVAGVPFSIVVTALDADGNVITDFAGTVHFRSSDSMAGLPDDYTFTADDAGVHTFEGVVLKRAGDQWIQVADTTTAVAGYVVATVIPAPADHFRATAPVRVTSGRPFDFTIIALDPFGNIDVNYTGTVTFSSTDTDAGVVLPLDYTFTTDDAGTHTFTDTGRRETTLITVGDQTITVSDGTISIDITVTVDSAGGQAPSRPDRQPGSAVLLLSEMAARAPAGHVEAVIQHQVAARLDQPFVSTRQPDARASAGTGAASNETQYRRFVPSTQRARLASSAHSAVIDRLFATRVRPDQRDWLADDDLQ